MAKATHLGHCQICNRLHKLPNGKVAKHGYTVEQGYFNGVCWGSDNLPYEQDKTLLEQHVVSFGKHIEEIKIRAEVVLKDLDPKNSWRNEYFYNERTGRGNYQYIRVEWRKSEKRGLEYRRIDDKEEKWHIDRVAGGYYTIEDAAKHGAKGLSKKLENQADFFTRMLEDDKKRLAAWKPNQPLKPI